MIPEMEQSSSWAYLKLLECFCAQREEAALQLSNTPWWCSCKHVPSLGAFKEQGDTFLRKTEPDQVLWERNNGEVGPLSHLC